MTDQFYDGVRMEASRTNQAAGRSFHIPAASRRRAFYVVTAVQLIACSSVVGLFWAVLS